MSRTAINFLLDGWLLFNLVVMLWIATMLAVVFPEPTAAAGYTLWGLDYNEWAAASYALLIVFTVAVLLHLVLHWSWVCGFVRHRMARFTGQKAAHDSGMNTIYGVTMLIGLLVVAGVLLTIANIAVRTP